MIDDSVSLEPRDCDRIGAGSGVCCDRLAAVGRLVVEGELVPEDRLVAEGRLSGGRIAGHWLALEEYM